MTPMTEKTPPPAPPTGHKMSPEWEKTLEKVIKENEEALRRLAKL